METDAVVHERRRDRGVGGMRLVRGRVQRRDRVEQAGAGAEVAVERRRGRGGVPGLQVGVHVAATEAVDRLLGIADQVQRRRVPSGIQWLARVAGWLTEHAPEDRPLARVGVLEFVDQRNRVLPAQRGDQLVAARAVECIGHAVDQVVVGLQPAHALEFDQARAGLVADAMQQRGAARIEP